MGVIGLAALCYMCVAGTRLMGVEVSWWPPTGAPTLEGAGTVMLAAFILLLLMGNAVYQTLTEPPKTP